MWPESHSGPTRLSSDQQRLSPLFCGAWLVFRLAGYTAGPYPRHVTELPIDDTAGLANAAHEAAERGQVIYLTDPQGRRIAAIVPASVAAAGTAAIGALEDAADLAVAEDALAEWDADDRRTYSLADVDAEISES